MAFGHAFGGFAQGMSMARQDNRRDQEEKRRKEEHEYLKQERARQDNVRREAGNALSNIGQQREDGSVYDEDTAYADAARLTAPHDYAASEQLRTAGLQRKTARVQAKGIERQERYQQNEEDTMALLQRIQALPDDQYYREIAKFATRYGNDGKSFGVDFDHNAGYKLTMVSDGAVKSVPVRDRKQVERMVMSYASPKFHQQAEELGLKERTVEVAERNAATNESWRQHQAGLTSAQTKAWLALANQRDNAGSMPAADKMRLEQFGRMEQVVTTRLADLSKAIDTSNPQGQAQFQQMSAQLNSQMRQLRKQSYELRKKHGLVNGPLWQEMGDPPPLEKAKHIMSLFANMNSETGQLRAGLRRMTPQDELDFSAGLAQFEQNYGDDPEAAYAMNALQTFRQQMFWGNVRPQNNVGDFGLPPGLTPANFAPGMPQGPRAAPATGLTNMPQSASQYPFEFRRPSQFANSR